MYMEFEKWSVLHLHYSKPWIWKNITKNIVYINTSSILLEYFLESRFRSVAVLANCSKFSHTTNTPNKLLLNFLSTYNKTITIQLLALLLRVCTKAITNYLLSWINIQNNICTRSGNIMHKLFICNNVCIM